MWNIQLPESRNSMNLQIFLFVDPI
uniref:Uncharacterized protein n=1 Tax=Arundo donax TaxID=35708 RepID=A0A0A9C8A7_ARUDO